jgi:hypothetical protein
MSKQFIVRIELHGAESKDYKDLHKSMGSRSFERTMQVDGEGKKLPTGTYVGDPNSVGPTVADALEKARVAAVETLMKHGFTFSIVVASTHENLAVENLEDDDTSHSL